MSRVECALIGVMAQAGQTSVVEEFFELFKTPWEPYRPNQRYDIVIATSNEMPRLNPKVLLVYSSNAVDIDSQIGIIPQSQHRGAVLSKGDVLAPIYGELLTFSIGSKGIPCVKAGHEVAGLVLELPGFTLARLGYDIFDEVQFLLSTGQPPEAAASPTLDIHVSMLRQLILEAGIPLLEIPPVPAGQGFCVCLTHDIDFMGIRRHRFDHSMWGFLYRATFGAARNFIRGRLPLMRLLKSWIAVGSLPLVYAGWARDFWEPFDWYLRAEAGIPSTYFLIPFKKRPGEKLCGRHTSRRAAAYDVSELSYCIRTVLEQGCELGVHGIDAWHSEERGREELTRLAGAIGNYHVGIRTHWLLQDANTPLVLDRAGYDYDSTSGYNETVGYRAGTTQVFRPPGARTLLELPLHIQDGALFLRNRLDLSEQEARQLCEHLVNNAVKFGGVLTILWHDRSHAPERFWGDFYIRLLQCLKRCDAWFGTAAQVVGWFAKRRKVRFEPIDNPCGSLIRPRYEGDEIKPPLLVRIYRPPHRSPVGDSGNNATHEFIDIPWDGTSADVTESYDFVFTGGLSS